MWLKALKIAIIEKNSDKVSKLLDDVPQELSQDELVQAQYLLESAKEFIQALQDETKASMIQMQKNIKFLQSTQAPHRAKLDISS